MNPSHDWQLGNLNGELGCLSPDLIGPSPAPLPAPEHVRWSRSVLALPTPRFSRDSALFRLRRGLPPGRGLLDSTWQVTGMGASDPAPRASPFASAHASHGSFVEKSWWVLVGRKVFKFPRCQGNFTGISFHSSSHTHYLRYKFSTW